MIPISLYVIAGIFISISTALNSYLFKEVSIFYIFFSFFSEIGLMILNCSPFWFSLAIAFGLASKERGWAAFSSAIFFFTFNKSIELYSLANGWNKETTSVEYLTKVLGWSLQRAQNFNAIWKEFLGIFTFDLGIFGGILIAIITVIIHEKLIDKERKGFLHYFSKSKGIIFLLILISIPLSILIFYIWPIFCAVIQNFSQWVISLDILGTFLFGIVDKLLMLLGLEKILEFPIFYTKVGGIMIIDGSVYEGVLNILNAQFKSQDIYSYIVRNFDSGKILIQLGGLPGASFAMYKLAKENCKKSVASILILFTSICMLIGITQPLEYLILFVNPILYFLFHIPFSGLAYFLTEYFKVSIHSTSLIGMFSNILFPEKVKAIPLLILIPFYFLLYYFGFKLIILKFDILTIGRKGCFLNDGLFKEDLKSKKPILKKTCVYDFETLKMEEKIVQSLGGIDNLEQITSCSTRLIVYLKDEYKIAQNDFWMQKLEAQGVIKAGKTVQIIYGPRVKILLEKIKKLLEENQD